MCVCVCVNCLTSVTEQDKAYELQNWVFEILQKEKVTRSYNDDFGKRHFSWQFIQLMNGKQRNTTHAALVFRILIEAIIYTQTATLLHYHLHDTRTYARKNTRARTHAFTLASARRRKRCNHFNGCDVHGGLDLSVHGT